MGLFDNLLKYINKDTSLNVNNSIQQIDRTKKNIDINIGLDFGTSFSKVCFAERKTFNFVKFEKDEFKSSVVYFDKKTLILYYNKPKECYNIEEIKYFKYSMIDEDLPKSKNLGNLKYDVKPEILCSIFFLACLIKESKDYTFKYYNKVIGDIEINWYITMGVPIDNYDNKNHKLYDRLLILADKLNSVLKEDSISFEELYKYYLDNENIKIPEFKESKLNTVPELYAESLSFLQNNNVMEGIYLLVDIGGGTVDMAIMFKEAHNKFSIVSKDIKPLGIEIVTNNIITDISKNELVKLYLKNNYNLSSYTYILEEKEKYYKNSFNTAYATIIAKGLKENGIWKNDIEQALIKKKGVIEIYICGGGAKHKWYEDGIWQKNIDLYKLLAIGLKLEIKPVEKLLPKEINHRLLIAYTLAQPVENIPDLLGFPWHFHTEKIEESVVVTQVKEKPDVFQIYGEYL